MTGALVTRCMLFLSLQGPRVVALGRARSVCILCLGCTLWVLITQEPQVSGGLIPHMLSSLRSSEQVCVQTDRFLFACLCLKAGSHCVALASPELAV